MKNKNEFKTIYVNKISKNGVCFSYNFALKTCLICTNLLKKEASKKAKKKYADNKEKRKIRAKNKRKTDPSFRIKENISRRMRHVLNVNSGSKNNKSISQFLNYNKNKLKNHLESQFDAWMNSENYGIYNKETWNDNEQKTWTWQIDHIIPQCLLKYWALENLRPLSSKQNFLLGLKVKKNAM